VKANNKSVEVMSDTAHKTNPEEWSQHHFEAAGITEMRADEAKYSEARMRTGLWQCFLEIHWEANETNGYGEHMITSLVVHAKTLANARHMLATFVMATGSGLDLVEDEMDEAAEAASKLPQGVLH
jgi:hypothetical protein